jgi:hypothetical protein
MAMAVEVVVAECKVLSMNWTGRTEGKQYLSHDKFTTLRPTKCTALFLRYLYYNITLNIATCFDPLWDRHQGIKSKQ